MTDQILDQVRRLAAELFDAPLNSISAASTPATLENWDSIQQLNLILALEDQFGIRFEPEDMEKMQSIGQVADAVRAHQR